MSVLSPQFHFGLLLQSFPPHFCALVACLLVLPAAGKRSRSSLLKTAFQLISKSHILHLPAEVLQERLAETGRYAND